MKLKFLILSFLILATTSYSQLIEMPNLKHEKAFGKNDANDEKTGEWEFYGKDRSIVAKVHYENGKRNGETKLFWENGNLYQSLGYVNNSIEGLQKIYYKDGSIADIKTYKNGLKNGESKRFLSNGNVRLIENYKDDILHGAYMLFEFNGELYYKGTYENGEKHGEWIHFNEGKISKSGIYKNGIKNGKWNHFDKGKISQSGIYKNGIKNGKWLKYRNEKVTKEFQYENEKLISVKDYFFSNELFKGKKLENYIEYEIEITEEDSIAQMKMYIAEYDQDYKDIININYWIGSVKFKLEDYIDYNNEYDIPSLYLLKDENSIGKWGKYTFDGHSIGKATCSNGREIKKEEYYNNGSIKSTTEIIKDFSNKKRYYENGDLRYEGKYYFPSNIKYPKIIYGIVYDKNGLVIQEDTINTYMKYHVFKGKKLKMVYDCKVEEIDGVQVQGILHGKFIAYNAENNVVRTGLYANGRPTGIWKDFDKFGNVIKEYEKK